MSILISPRSAPMLHFLATSPCQNCLGCQDSLHSGVGEKNRNGRGTGLDPRKTVPYFPPSFEVDEGTRTRNLQSTEVAEARMPPAASSPTPGPTTHRRPIAPGNGSGSPPPWDLDRSGGLFFLSAGRGDRRQATSRLQLEHALQPTSRRRVPVDPRHHARGPRVGSGFGRRRLDLQPRRSPPHRRHGLCARFSGVLEGDARRPAPPS